MDYDAETRDLAQLAASRVSNAINSVLQLCSGPDQALQVGMLAAGAAMGSATGAISAKYGCTHDEAKLLLLDLILKTPPLSAEDRKP